MSLGRRLGPQILSEQLIQPLITFNEFSLKAPSPPSQLDNPSWTKVRNYVFVDHSFSVSPTGGHVVRLVLSRLGDCCAFIEHQSLMTLLCSLIIKLAPHRPGNSNKCLACGVCIRDSPNTPTASERDGKLYPLPGRSRTDLFCGYMGMHT